MGRRPLGRHHAFFAAVAYATYARYYRGSPVVGRGKLGFWHTFSERQKAVKQPHVGYQARLSRKEWES